MNRLWKQFWVPLLWFGLKRVQNIYSNKYDISINALVEWIYNYWINRNIWDLIENSVSVVVRMDEKE